MQILGLTVGPETLIAAYKSQGAYPLGLGDGHGEGCIYHIRIEPGGVIGPHSAGCGQLFLVMGETAGSAGRCRTVPPLPRVMAACWTHWLFSKLLRRKTPNPRMKPTSARPRWGAVTRFASR